MIVSVQNARHVKDYRIWLKFNTEEAGEVDLRDLVFHYAAAQSIRDVEAFKNFYLDEWPSLAWSCGFDVSPETLYELATNKRIPWLQPSCAGSESFPAELLVDQQTALDLLKKAGTEKIEGDELSE